MLVGYYESKWRVETVIMVITGIPSDTTKERKQKRRKANGPTNLRKAGNQTAHIEKIPKKQPDNEATNPKPWKYPAQQSGAISPY